MKPTTKRALIAAGVMAGVSGFLTTPEPWSWVCDGVVSFILIFGVLFLCVRFLPLASWSVARQRLFVWIVAVGIGASYTFMPLAMRLMSR